MTETLYPDGYGARMVTLTTLRAKHEPHMHPEFARRLFAWLESCGGLVGIGGGYRPAGAQPDRPGFAPEGMSFHQGQPFVNYPATYSAVDLVVVNPGGSHRAPRWSEVPAKGSAESVRRGLHCHIATESWHMQAVEVRGYTTWRLAGRKDPQRFYPIPSTPAKVFAPKATQQRRLPGMDGLNSKSEVVTLQNACIWFGWHDDHNRPPLADGKFGALTGQCVANMQRALEIPVDGKYGPQSQRALQAFFDALAVMAAAR